MKFSCEKALLQNAISTASRAVSPKSTIPALEGLLLEAGHLVSITGYNLETGIRTIVNAYVEEPGTIVLPARLFGEIIRKFPDDVVVIETDNMNVRLSCGMSEFNLIGIDPDDFPDLPEVDYQNAFTLPQRTLRAMIGETLFAVSDNESRPIHTGSLFEVTTQHLTLVSVDGFRLAMRREEITQSEGEFTFVVPGKALSEVEKICKETEEDATVNMGAKHAVFQVGETMLVSRRLEGEFLAWEKAIPKNNPIRITTSAKRLLQSIDRVSLIITDKLKSPLRCEFGDSQVRLTTKTAMGDALDTCEVEGDGKGLEIGFNNKYVMDALKVVPADNVCIELSSGVAPCVISPAEDEEDNFIYMILPVRLKAGE